MTVDTFDRIKVGDRWAQVTSIYRDEEDGSLKQRIRVIEITGRPTLSSPVNYRIVRNDEHPHREGKHASIRAADLFEHYYPMGTAA